MRNGINEQLSKLTTSMWGPATAHGNNHSQSEQSERHYVLFVLLSDCVFHTKEGQKKRPTNTLKVRIRMKWSYEKVTHIQRQHRC